MPGGSFGAEVGALVGALVWASVTVVAKFKAAVLSKVRSRRRRFGIPRGFATARPERATGVVAGELLERPARDRPAEVRHEPLVEPNIMHGNQNRAKHL